jgi:hypothetical protein
LRINKNQKSYKMKKIYLLAIGFVLASAVNSNAQDTLLYEGFDYQSFYDNLVDDVVPPPANASDPLWYSYDADGLTSANGRPGGWYGAFPFSDVDTIDADLDGFNENAVLASDSWFGSPAAVENWLISPSIILEANDTLYWKSAPYQTPRYLDGYKIMLSTTTNDNLAFTTTLFTAAEMVSTGTDTVFSTFGFSPGVVHGEDGNYIDFADQSSMLHIGQLRPFAVSLAAFAGQNVFIAVLHDSFDDNLISIDDILIRGNNTPLGVANASKGDIGLNVFPNPSTDNAQVNYNLANETNVTINIYDVAGKLISSENKGSEAAGRHFSLINTSDMANGFYTVTVLTNNGSTTTKMIVK